MSRGLLGPCLLYCTGRKAARVWPVGRAKLLRESAPSLLHGESRRTIPTRNPLLSNLNAPRTGNCGLDGWLLWSRCHESERSLNAVELALVQWLVPRFD